MILIQEFVRDNEPHHMEDMSFQFFLVSKKKDQYHGTWDNLILKATLKDSKK